MSLARHVNPDDIIQRLHGDALKEQDDSGGSSSSPSDPRRGQAVVTHLTPYTSRYASQVCLPKYKIPREGAEADTVYSMIKDELDLDGKPNLNLASFVGTYLESTAEKLMIENMSKNLSDMDEYPAMIAMHQRCVSILAHLWGVQDGEKAIGSATTGSSEAIHLGGLAMKRRWQEARQAAGKDASKPNIIMGANAQVALEKFARYFDVEARILPVSAASRFRLDPKLVRDNLDENTIGVFVVLGSTYTGHYEPVEEVSRVLDDFQRRTGVDVPIHVDAASGGFVAPFTHAGVGGAKWNFELPRVKSINVSGHKYGLVTAGVGWIVWRDEAYLPKHLIFELHYLGGTEQSYTLNFSRPGAQVIVQYYNLIHLGFDGYRAVMESCLANARLLSKSLEATGWYTCMSDIHRPASSSSSSGLAAPPKDDDPPYSPSSIDSIAQTIKTTVLPKKSSKQKDESANENSADFVAGLPVVSFRLSDEFRREFPHVKQETVSLLLRARQWIVPNYALPPNEQDIEILRVVVRESMSLDLLDRLVADVCEVTQTLMDAEEGYEKGVGLSILGKHRQGVQEAAFPGKPGKEGDQGEVGGKPQHQLQRHRHRHPHLGAKDGKKKMEDGIHRTVC